MFSILNDFCFKVLFRFHNRCTWSRCGTHLKKWWSRPTDKTHTRWVLDKCLVEFRKLVKRRLELFTRQTMFLATGCGMAEEEKRHEMKTTHGTYVTWLRTWFSQGIKFTTLETKCSELWSSMKLENRRNES